MKLLFICRLLEKIMHCAASDDQNSNLNIALLFVCDGFRTPRQVRLSLLSLFTSPFLQEHWFYSAHLICKIFRHFPTLIFQPRPKSVLWCNFRVDWLWTLWNAKQNRIWKMTLLKNVFISADPSRVSRLAWFRQLKSNLYSTQRTNADFYQI